MDCATIPPATLLEIIVVSLTHDGPILLKLPRINAAKTFVAISYYETKPSMSHTVHVVCDPTEFDKGVTVAEDALVRDLLVEAGVTNSLESLTYSPCYYQNTQPVSISILLPVTRIPDGETLFVHRRE
jgi:hypothetical protein